MRADVAVNDAERSVVLIGAVVGVAEPPADLGDHVNHHVDRQLFAGAVRALDQPAQRLAMDVLEGNVVARLDLAEVEDSAMFS